MLDNWPLRMLILMQGADPATSSALSGFNIGNGARTVDGYIGALGLFIEAKNDFYQCTGRCANSLSGYL